MALVPLNHPSKLHENKGGNKSYHLPVGQWSTLQRYTRG
jgi:hypothetical protein